MRHFPDILRLFQVLPRCGVTDYISLHAPNGSRSGLDLAGIQRYCKICNRCVLCLTGTVGRNCCVTCFVCHLDCFKSLRYRSNLIQFDQNRISASKLNSFRQSLCVCDKKIISNQLNFISQLCCQLFPAFPVFLIKCIFD